MTLQNGKDDDENPPSQDESFVENELSLGRLPPKSERLKDSEGLKIAKLCGDTDWQPRFLAITAERIIIAHPGHDEISDQIPLVSIIVLSMLIYCIMTHYACFRFSA
jgi:hypothetical protein